MPHENENYVVMKYDMPIGRVWYVVDKKLNLAVKMTLSMQEAMDAFESLSKKAAA